MAEFQAEIRNIAKENEQRRKDKSERMMYMTDVEKNSEIKGAMKRLFSLSELGVKAYNKGAGEKVLSIYELPEELLTLFLNLPGKRMGFCIISPERFVAFLDEVPNQVLVLGQKRQGLGVTGQVLTKARQLIKVTCLKSGDVLIFKDNTGANLNLEDVIKQIIKWISG
ncbi:MAG TPA: hypothetical protein VFF49_09885 [Thermodesulfobacteriota bacterium]|nr:hypothetical protein [Thermodesulfobacteriota bacterium]